MKRSEAVQYSYGWGCEVFFQIYLEHLSPYSFVINRIPLKQKMLAGKAVLNLLLPSTEIQLFSVFSMQAVQLFNVPYIFATNSLPCNFP